MDRAELLRPVHEVAPRLLGARLEHRSREGVVVLEITEVEAYAGEGEDPASHAHRGRTPRNSVMFGQPGRLYVYRVYGVHWCLNVVTGETGTASAVLIRAGDVVAGIELAQRRRGGLTEVHRYAQGPGNVAVALGLTGAYDDVDLLDSASPVHLDLSPDALEATSDSVSSGPRIGISRAVDRPWRWWLEGRRSVSRPRVRRSDAPR